VTTVRRGREKLHYLNAAPISEIAERWIDRYDQQRIAALSDLKKALEEPEWAAAYDVSDEDLARFASERRSKVTFDLEPLGEIVKLTVVHDGFDPGSVVLPGITEGWPRILSDLKTLLETSDTLLVR
jgi:Activator of Hsp90 ATPase homolog 1-like protein